MRLAAATTLALTLVTSVVRAQEPTITSLLSRELADAPGKELLMITVEYPAGGSDPAHTHDAHAMVYVLEGSVVMQVEGRAPVTLVKGQSFYESPDDVHVVARNASTTAPARFLVVFLKKTGAQVLTRRQ